MLDETVEKSSEKDLGDANNLSGTENDGVADIATDVLNDSPEVSEHVISDQTEESGASIESPLHPNENPNGPVKGETDKFGLRGTEGIHARNEDGSFKVGKTTGFLVIIPGVNHPLKNRPKPNKQPDPLSMPNQGTVIGDPIEGQTGTIAAPSQPMNMGAKDAAKAATALAISGAFVFFDENEAKPEPGEIEYLEDTFERYFVAKDIQDFPPGIALTVALGSFYGKRVVKPKSQKKFTTIIAYGAKKVGSFFKSIFKRKKKHAKDPEKETA